MLDNRNYREHFPQSRGGHPGAALEIPPEERAAYLDKACAGDADLRRRVEELVRAQEQAGDFLEAPAVGLDPVKFPKISVPPAEKPGDKIGHYKLLQQIGDGELARDDVRKTLLGFWSVLAFGMTRDTYSPVEVTMIETGENHYTLPHLYSCTDQLRLLRNLLLREDGDALWIRQAIPRDWLGAGKHVAVKSTPTEFGDVGYRIDVQADGQIRVSLTPPDRRNPSEIRVRLRTLGAGAIKSAKATPEAEISFTGDTVTIRDLKGRLDLQVAF